MARCRRMSRDVIRHPGPAAADPCLVAMGQGRVVRATLTGGQSLMAAVSDLMDRTGCDSGVIVVDGLTMGPYDYVMPGPSDDGIHAAWYSATHHGDNAQVRQGSAIVGRRDGAWWLHCHAIWEDAGAVKCGHLLPDDVTLPADCAVVLYAFDGGRFEVSMNAETLFPIFHATGGEASGNAMIVKVNPHHDIHATLSDAIRQAGFDRARVVGIGSLIGAQFESGPPMLAPISEVLLLSGAVWQNGALRLPMYCVDPDDGQFSGDILPGGAPVLITFEALVIAE